MASLQTLRPGRLLLHFLLLFLAWGHAQPADPTLTVANHLALPLKLVHVPGCCTPCGWIDPPPELQCYAHGCVRCPNLTIEAGAAMAMHKKVGPYPLPFLRMEVENVEYCVADEDLELVTAEVTLTVGPGMCSSGGKGLKGSVTRDVEEVVEEERAPLRMLCVPLCPPKVT